MRRQSRPAAIAALACAAVLLTGCGGNPAPKALPTPSPSPNKTPSPSPTPPALPAVAKLKTKAGAEAFGRHYISMINYAQETGDVTQLASVESRTCQSCKKSESFVREVYANGGKISGGSLRIQQITSVKDPSASGYLVEVGVAFGPQILKRSRSSAPTSLSGGQLPLNIQVEWANDGWRVLEWTRGA